MRYKVEFQYKPKDHPRPYDEAYAIIEVEAGDVGLIPNVGDFVDIDESMGGEVRGVVLSRLFNYLNISSGAYCSINIVVTDTDVDWGRLLKM